MTEQATITAERQTAAQHVAMVFNSVQQFIETLKHENDKGEKLLSEHLRNAHARVEEAATWAVKHVLTFGPPPAPPAPEPTTEFANEQPAAAPAEPTVAVKPPVAAEGHA